MMIQAILTGNKFMKHDKDVELGDVINWGNSTSVQRMVLVLPGFTLTYGLKGIATI
jgi:hypothetical protein